MMHSSPSSNLASLGTLAGVAASLLGATVILSPLWGAPGQELAAALEVAILMFLATTAFVAIGIFRKGHRLLGAVIGVLMLASCLTVVASGPIA